DRFLIVGTDWGLELGQSLSAVGSREVAVRLLDDRTRARARRDGIERFWSIALLTGDEARGEGQGVDLLRPFTTPPPGLLPEAERGRRTVFLPLSASGRGLGGGVLKRRLNGV